MRLPSAAALAAGLAFLAAGPAFASETAPHIHGADLSLYWTIPFAGILLSIALMPLMAPSFWHHNFGKVALFWAVIFIAPFAVVEGAEIAGFAVAETLLLEYLPFIILIFTLFVVSGGIYISGNLIGTPKTNAGILAFGTLTASMIGTTGASMLLIRPLLRANISRHHKTHVFVFFIFLVSNVGGALTPLGDPPLFIGYLQGVEFGWTVEHMALPMAVTAGILLALFYVLDLRAWNKEAMSRDKPSRMPRNIRIQGLGNIVLLAAVIIAVVTTGTWNAGTVHLWHLEFKVSGLVRDLVLITIALISLKITKPTIRVENAFAWEPIQEVAILFFAIFLTMIPALAILRAGTEGAMAGLAAFTTGPDGSPVPAAYFWLTGVLSSFLDNAPTYLVFFNLAGGDAQTLMGPLNHVLVAISAGAVFMGANTYIGNAPNFMVKSICEEQKIRMPSFFGYMAWSVAILIPIFILLTVLMFI
ncbi:sodium:proton antiporter [Indioceanicola profundi]|uniref:sodium:proton antiporter n=1 Tax=Indioceanicola profundi TaxID=2220096 RepID=UPI001CEC4AAB|nr:sodium:proton antiporter [Indioceanicola profundi]